jgi:hypothetical protein
MIIRKTSETYDDDDKGNSFSASKFRPKTILVLGIVLAAIGILVQFITGHNL